ncbi:MAG TPA: signal peptidase II [Myxococcota bacterium]|nr:signal peptidase II [Myxococcota bacterium]
MNRPRFAAFVAILVFAGGCDHATKHLARETLGGSPAISLAADTVRFQLTENPGGFLSLGAHLPPELRRVFFLAFAPLAMVLVAIPILRSRSRSFGPVFALALVAGGGLANWVERLWNDGAVTDFVSVGIGSLRTGIFNLADVFVLAGVAVLLVTGLGESPPGAGERPEGPEAPA